MRLLTVLLLASQLMVWQGFAGVFDCGCETEMAVAADCCSSQCADEEAQSFPVDDTCLCCISHDVPLSGAEWTSLEIPSGSKQILDSPVLLKPVAVITPEQVSRQFVLAGASPCRAPADLRQVSSSWLL